MDLSKIISIAGKPGLYQIISQSRGGVIVTSLDNGKKMAIGQTQRVSALSDISVYTLDGDILLQEIFERIHAHIDGKAIEVDIKSDAAIRDFFTEVVPEHDDSRVYHSDIRKLIKWYNGLLDKGLLTFEAAEPDASGTPAVEEVAFEEVMTNEEETPAVEPAAAEKAKPAPKSKKESKAKTAQKSTDKE